MRALLREPAGRQRSVRRSGLGLLAVRLRAVPRLGAKGRRRKRPQRDHAYLREAGARHAPGGGALPNRPVRRGGSAREHHPRQERASAAHSVRRDVAGAGVGGQLHPEGAVGPNFNTVGCGKLLDAIKYEKYIETAFTNFSGWFLDERGWGDLPANSPTFWATPFQDCRRAAIPCRRSMVPARAPAMRRAQLLLDRPLTAGREVLVLRRSRRALAAVLLAGCYTSSLFRGRRRR